MLSNVRGCVGWGWSNCSGCPIFIFLLKKNGFAPWQGIMLVQKLIYYWQDSELNVRQWSHSLMRPLHCLWAKSNDRKQVQFECDVMWFCFCFDFVRWHARCGCCSMVCLRFQVVQKNPKKTRLIAKWVLKIWIIINKRHFAIFLDSSIYKSIKPQKRR